MTSPAGERLIVLLHGVGSNGADLQGLGAYWAAALPGTVFRSPDAPSASGFGSGRQWFSLEGITGANRPERILAARPAFDALVGRIVADTGFADRLDRVVLAGFSQGAIMALDALASGRWPVAGIISFAGRLASPEPLAPATGTRLLLVHGEADAVIPADESRTAHVRLRALGVQAALELLPDLGHGISPAAAALARPFIAAATPEA